MTAFENEPTPGTKAESSGSQQVKKSKKSGIKINNKYLRRDGDNRAKK
jgi:hypothetical protein